MSKADTDYLERRLIQDLQEKSDYEMMNSTTENSSYIDKLQNAKSDQLYDTVFEIIDEIANIDLFGTSEDNETPTYEYRSSGQYEVDYATGLFRAINEKKLSSKIGAKGITKKIMTFLLVGVAHMLDVEVIKGGNVLRDARYFLLYLKHLKRKNFTVEECRRYRTSSTGKVT